jgi:hypothetical protein
MLLRARRSVQLTVAGLTVGVLVAACGTVRAPGAAAGGRAEQQARVYAQRLLAKLGLPAGARRTAWPGPRNRLLKPMLPDWLHDVVNVQVLYQVGAPGVAGQFLAGHVPAGMMAGESGQGGAGGGVYVDYIPRHLPPGIASAYLATVIIPASSGALLRADAQVVWYPPRSEAEYIHPGGYRSVTVTAPAVPGASPADAVTRTFTASAVIAKLASLLNHLPVLVPTVMSCPVVAGAPLRLVFTPAASRWPRIVVTPSGCFADNMRVAGRGQPALDDHGNGTISAMLRLLDLHAG